MGNLSTLIAWSLKLGKLAKFSFKPCGLANCEVYANDRLFFISRLGSQSYLLSSFFLVKILVFEAAGIVVGF